MWIRALLRALVIALAIWVGQLVLTASHKAGIWAMVSLGIASAILGLGLVEVFAAHRGRRAQVTWHFLATLIVMEAFYMLLPRVSIPAFNADFVLSLGVAVISGLSEWLVKDMPLA